MAFLLTGIFADYHRPVTWQSAPARFLEQVVRSPARPLGLGIAVAAVVVGGAPPAEARRHAVTGPA